MQAFAKIAEIIAEICQSEIHIDTSIIDFTNEIHISYLIQSDEISSSRCHNWMRQVLVQTTSEIPDGKYLTASSKQCWK